jgi:hypothetical protein
VGVCDHSYYESQTFTLGWVLRRGCLRITSAIALRAVLKSFGRRGRAPSTYIVSSRKRPLHLLLAVPVKPVHATRPSRSATDSPLSIRHPAPSHFDLDTSVIGPDIAIIINIVFINPAFCLVLGKFRHFGQCLLGDTRT